jgi:phage major head subunit gpT-like protein
LAGIKALFDQNYLPLRDAQGKLVAPIIGPIVRVIPSTQGEEVLTALGAAPGLAEWKGELTPEKLAAWKQTVINRLFDASVEIGRTDWEDDRIGQYDAAIQDMATRASYHPAELAAATLEANGTAFDGTALFSASRTIGESGTINNALTPAMAGTAPTNIEMETAVLAAIAAMKAFKNNKGKPAGIAPEFSLIVPTALEPAASIVAKNEMLWTGTAAKSNDARGKFTPVELTFLTSDVIAYLAVTNYAAKPVVMTDREPLSMTQDGEDSHNWRNLEKSITRVRARREMAPGVPWLIARLTFTHA